MKDHMRIRDLKEEGFSIAAIARKCGVSRNTVYNYLEMDWDEALDWVETLKTRTRKLDSYKDYILAWLKEHPDLSASQISDWLEEKHAFKEAGDSTIRTYVKELREKYHIPKTLTYRSFEALEESPQGKQMQVDFGEQRVKTSTGKTIKLYVIIFVLSHSRCKYAEWQDRPFTTRDVLRTHENAFHYYGGMTEEIVYDQDTLMTVSENGGDIMFTEAFQSYKNERGFKVHLCRKADPQSKGKVENAVKFIKQNFGKNRVFHQLDSWNDQCLSWLERKGNYQVHHTIKKRPIDVFALEKPHLRPVSSPLSFESTISHSISRTVHKDNIIKFQSNRYTVPLGTYKPYENNIVTVQVQDQQVMIWDPSSGKCIAIHPLAAGKGHLIKNTHHSRDCSQGLADYRQAVKTAFRHQEHIDRYLEALSQQYPRYIRDQLQILQRSITKYPTVIDQALERCIKDGLWSANDFYDVANHLASSIPHAAASTEAVRIPGEMPEPSGHAPVAEREMDTYLEILGGAE